MLGGLHYFDHCFNIICNSMYFEMPFKNWLPQTPKKSMAQKKGKEPLQRIKDLTQAMELPGNG